MKSALVVCSFMSTWAVAAAPPTDLVPPKDYVVSVTAPPEVSAGVPVDYTITVAAKPGWLVKAETPFEASVKTCHAMVADKSDFTDHDYVDAKAADKSVKTRLTISETGEHLVTTDVTFFVCNDMMCKREHEIVTTKIVAKPPATALMAPR